MVLFSYAADFWVKEKKEMKGSLSVPKKMASGELCWTTQRKGKKKCFKLITQPAGFLF